MPIWSAEIKELEKLYESIKGQLPELEKELVRLIKTDDENIILVYARRCLEVIITDLCECELNRPRKTEPLKGIIDKLHKEEKVPSHIITSMHGLNELSTYGAHPKDYDPEQVKPVLVNLDIIIKWYLKYKNIATDDKTEVDEEKTRLGKGPVEEVTIKERTEVQEKPAKAGKRKLTFIVTFAAILVIAAIIAYPKIFKKNAIERLISSGERISVAIMPFQNMTNDTTWNVWQKGIQDMLVTDLSNSPDELKVRQTLQINTLIQSRGLTNYASMTPSLAGTISKKLDANVFIYGSIKQAGTKMRVNAELIDTKTKETLKSFEIEDTAKEEKIFLIIDSLKTQVKNFLVISKLKKGTSLNLQRYGNTYSPEAYRLFLNGDEAVWNGDAATALKLYKEAVAIDSNFVAAKLYMVAQYMFLGLYSEAKEWCLKIYKERDHIPMMYRNNINWLHSRLFETPLESIKYLRQELQSYGDQAVIYGIIGSEYLNLHQYDKAIPEYEKVLKLKKEWDENPTYGSYTLLGFAYHKTGQYKKEKKLYREAVNYFPDNPNVIFRQAVLELTEGDTITANKYIEKYISIMKENARAESVIMVNLGNIYNQAGTLDKAEKYYRKALSLEPENPVRMNTLAWFLIDNDRNIKEGMQHVGKALEFNPANFEFLDTKGWGLYKQGKYQEALKFLQKSDSLKPIYNHETFLHLEAARKAVAEQRNN